MLASYIFLKIFPKSEKECEAEKIVKRTKTQIHKTRVHLFFESDDPIIME